MLGLQALYIAIETGGLLLHLFTFTIILNCENAKAFLYFSALAASESIFGLLLKYTTNYGSLISVALSLALLRPFVKWNTVLQQLGLSS